MRILQHKWALLPRQSQDLQTVSSEWPLCLTGSLQRRNPRVHHKWFGQLSQGTVDSELELQLNTFTITSKASLDFQEQIQLPSPLMRRMKADTRVTCSSPNLTRNTSTMLPQTILPRQLVIPIQDRIQLAEAESIPNDIALSWWQKYWHLGKCEYIYTHHSKRKSSCNSKAQN